MAEKISPVLPEMEERFVEYIYRWSFRHPATGKIVRPKNGRPFRIPVQAKPID